jgi:hypothetical protein
VTAPDGESWEVFVTHAESDEHATSVAREGDQVACCG